MIFKGKLCDWLNIHEKSMIIYFIFQFLSSMPRSKDDRVFVISCEEDRSVCKKPLDAGIPVVSAEVLLTGVLRQELNLEEYPFVYLKLIMKRL